MSREKQIEDMANILWHIPHGYNLNSYNDCEVIAECIYDDGYYRKQSVGEWIDTHHGKYENPIYACSQCGKGTLLKPHINELYNMEMIQALSPFCPNCGAKMKGGAK